jgi:plasmid stability protein
METVPSAQAVAQVERAGSARGRLLFGGSRCWYQLWYLEVMAMTLRLDEQEAEALRRRASREGRSMQEVARQAVREYIERTSRRELLNDVLDAELPRYAEALERLGR